MNGAQIQALIYQGMGVGAQSIGMPCAVFRPQNETAPLTNQVAQFPASFNAANPGYTKPQGYGKAVWYADMDGRQTRPGDYLVRLSDGHTWFISAQQQLLPIQVVECNRKIRIVRTQPVQGVGGLGYSGIVDPTPVLGTQDTPWPCSILQGGRPLPSVGLPSDVKDAGWKILLPYVLGFKICSADLIEDDIGRGFVVTSAEFTDLGWRLDANETHV